MGAIDESALPEIPQRIAGATTTPDYTDATTPTHTFQHGDIVTVTAGNHAGNLAVVVPPEEYPRWIAIKDTPQAASMVCLSFGVMAGLFLHAQHLTLHTPATALAAREVPGALGYTIAVFADGWDSPRLDSDGDGSGRHTLAEALVLVDAYRRSDRRWPGDRVELAAIVVVGDAPPPTPAADVALPVMGDTVPPSPIVLDDVPLAAGELVRVKSGGKYRDMLVRITEVTDSLAHGHHWNGSTSWSLDELERVPETAAARAAGRIPGSHDLGGPPAYIRTAPFKVGDRVIVTAAFHADHGRRGVVTSLDGKVRPIGVRVGTGLSAIIHYFHEHELAFDITTEGAAVLDDDPAGVLAVEPGVAE